MEAVRKEMARERAAMAAEIERLEHALEEQAASVETVTAQRDSEATARGEADTRLAALTVENARLDERARAAEKWAEELKAQFEGIQEKLAEMVKQAAKLRTTRKKAPSPKPGVSQRR